MRRSSSLRMLLTVNTLLIAAVAWTLIADRSMTHAALAGGGAGLAALPDAAAQRLEIIRELQRLNGAMRDLTAEVKSLKSATMEVEVTRMPDQPRPADNDSDDEDEGG